MLLSWLVRNNFSSRVRFELTRKKKIEKPMEKDGFWQFEKHKDAKEI